MKEIKKGGRSVLAERNLYVLSALYSMDSVHEIFASRDTSFDLSPTFIFLRLLDHAFVSTRQGDLEPPAPSLK